MKRFMAAMVCLAACSSPGQESGQPTRGSDPVPSLSIGRTATAQEIAALDIDVRPDGKGLPEGSGTAAAGRAVFADRCASCHGAEGQGTAAGEALVGGTVAAAFGGPSEGGTGGARKTIGSYWPYATTLYDYTNRAMPFDKPGSLTPNELYAVTAFLLWKNGIIGETDPMNRTTLPAVRMPARDKFVPDDRLKFKQVR
jgi:S-disulfanyl-L-cysteine oxidoreductase SoxD